MSRESQIAQAVASTINNATGYTIPVYASPTTMSRIFTDDIKELRVDVLPSALAWTRDSRSTWEHGYSILVVIAKKVLDDIEDLKKVAEEIIDVVKAAPRQAGVALRLIERDPIIDPERLEEDGIFQTQIVFTYSESL